MGHLPGNVNQQDGARPVLEDGEGGLLHLPGVCNWGQADPFASPSEPHREGRFPHAALLIHNHVDGAWVRMVVGIQDGLLPWPQASTQDWFEDFNLKFFSAAHLSRLCIPDMRKQKWGRIINTLNTAAKAPGAASCPTSVARAAGMAMTKALASEFASDGVLVNALNTGFLISNQWITRWQRDHSDKTFEEFTENIASKTPIGRMGEAQEFANLALFLASDAASYLTGASINIDGGLSPVV